MLFSSCNPWKLSYKLLWGMPQGAVLKKKVSHCPRPNSDVHAGNDTSCYTVLHFPVELSYLTVLIGDWESSEVYCTLCTESSIRTVILDSHGRSIPAAVPIDLIDPRGQGTPPGRTDNPKNSSKSAGKLPKYSLGSWDIFYHFSEKMKISVDCTYFKDPVRSCRHFIYYCTKYIVTLIDWRFDCSLLNEHRSLDSGTEKVLCPSKMINDLMWEIFQISIEIW